QWTKGNITLEVYPSLPIKLTSVAMKTLSVESLQVFTSAKNRLQSFIVQERYVSPNVNFAIPSETKKLSCLVVDVTTDQDFDLEIDESYTLEISDDSLIAKVSAKTIYGALHGLTTFSQLIYYDNDYLKHEKHRQAYLPFAPHKIVDAPVFKYRGLLLDTARNYYPVQDILRTLDVMSWNKLNVFHWHIVDATSWPVVSKAYPKLSEKGAYDPKTMIYTKQDISIIDEYAKLRGILVVPEFDMPGHTQSIAHGYPEIMSCVNEQPRWDLFSAEPPSGQLNPAIPETYSFLEGLIPEMASYFSSKYYHAGGDEVNVNCWSQDPSVKYYLGNNSGSTLDTLLGKFISKTHELVRKSNKIPIAWQEMIVDHNLTLGSDTLIQVWNDDKNLKK
ncbi:14947_t:CDS:2, partial [Acaulospora morrowiae]